MADIIQLSEARKARRIRQMQERFRKGSVCLPTGQAFLESFDQYRLALLRLPVTLPEGDQA